MLCIYCHIENMFQGFTGRSSVLTDSFRKVTSFISPNYEIGQLAYPNTFSASTGSHPGIQRM